MGLLLQQYDFEIVHRPGKVHGNADSLSRGPYVTSEFNSLSLSLSLSRGSTGFKDSRNAEA